jgi:hypothetical protein
MTRIKLKRLPSSWAFGGLLLLLFVQCTQEPTLRFELSETRTLEAVPSGSGLAKMNGFWYAVGDDAPYLFEFDALWRATDAIPLIAPSGYEGGRIPKNQKPDFETLEVLGKDELLVLGSGSKSPQRDLVFRVLIKDEVEVHVLSDNTLHDHLRADPAMEGAELNLEGIAVHEGYIYLLNRSNNLVFRYPHVNFRTYLQGRAPYPTPETKLFDLPKINGRSAGFSGACGLPGQTEFLVTASVEAAKDAYNDGRILGSFLGLLDWSTGTIRMLSIPDVNGPLKVESIAIQRQTANSAHLALITDDDHSNHSLILEGILFW